MRGNLARAITTYLFEANLYKNEPEDFAESLN